MKASLFARARAAPASPFLGFSPVSSHRGGKKKRSRMFGKICRSVEHFLHWCKRGGQQGRGRRGRPELGGRAPGFSPQPHMLLPGCVCGVAGGQIARSFLSLTHFPDGLCSPRKQHRLFLPGRGRGPPRNSALQLSPPTPVSQLPPPSPSDRHRSLRNHGGPIVETRPEPGLWLHAQTRPARTAWRGRESCARPPLPPTHGTAGWRRARRGCLHKAGEEDSLPPPATTFTGLQLAALCPPTSPLSQFTSKHTHPNPAPSPDPAPQAGLRRASLAAQQRRRRPRARGYLRRPDELGVRGVSGCESPAGLGPRPGARPEETRQPERREGGGGEGGGGGKRWEEGGGRGRRKRPRLSPPALRAEEFAARAAGLPQERRDPRGGGREAAAA